jgi:hypothetical protein
MKKNMGTIDKITRVVIAIAISILFATNVISGTLGIVLLILSIVFVVTSMISFCPLYQLFGINTCQKEK